MSDVAIRVEGLGKQYRIGRQQARYKTIREQIIDWSKSPFQRAGRILRGQGSAADLDETIWALKDNSFGVKWNEIIGAIVKMHFDEDPFGVFSSKANQSL